MEGRSPRPVFANVPGYASHRGLWDVRAARYEKMTENQELYARVGYLEYDRRPIEDFHVVFMRKQLAGDQGGL